MAQNSIHYHKDDLFVVVLITDKAYCFLGDNLESADPHKEFVACCNRGGFTPDSFFFMTLQYNGVWQKDTAQPMSFNPAHIAYVTRHRVEIQEWIEMPDED